MGLQSRQHLMRIRAVSFLAMMTPMPFALALKIPLPLLPSLLSATLKL